MYIVLHNRQEQQQQSIKVGVPSELEGLLAKCGAFTKNICPAEDPNHCSLGSSAALPKLKNRKHGSPEWEWAWGFGLQICFTNADTTTPVCSLVHRRSPFFRYARSHLSRLQTSESYIDASTTCVFGNNVELTVTWSRIARTTATSIPIRKRKRWTLWATLMGATTAASLPVSCRVCHGPYHPCCGQSQRQSSRAFALSTSHPAFAGHSVSLFASNFASRARSLVRNGARSAEYSCPHRHRKGPIYALQSHQERNT